MQPPHWQRKWGGFLFKSPKVQKQLNINAPFTFLPLSEGISQANGKPTGILDSDAAMQFAAEATTDGRYNDTYVQSQVERRNGNRAVSRRNRRGHLCENHTGVKVPWVQRHGRKMRSHCLGKSRINTDRKRNDWYKKKYEVKIIETQYLTTI